MEDSEEFQQARDRVGIWETAARPFPARSLLLFHPKENGAGASARAGAEGRRDPRRRAVCGGGRARVPALGGLETPWLGPGLGSLRE